MWYRFNGVELGDVGNNGTLDTTDLASIDARSQQRTTTAGAFQWGSTTGSPNVDFDGSYDPITTSRQGSVGGSSDS